MLQDRPGRSGALLSLLWLPFSTTAAMPTTVALLKDWSQYRHHRPSVLLRTLHRSSFGLFFCSCSFSFDGRSGGSYYKYSIIFLLRKNIFPPSWFYLYFLSFFSLSSSFFFCDFRKESLCDVNNGMARAKYKNIVPTN